MRPANGWGIEIAAEVCLAPGASRPGRFALERRVPGNPFYRSPFWRALRAAALRRDGYRCVIPGCRTPTLRLTVDHIQARPRGATGPTAADVLSNLRTLCDPHDRSLKEGRDGRRPRGGRPRGCDADGWPIEAAAAGRG